MLYFFSNVLISYIKYKPAQRLKIDKEKILVRIKRGLEFLKARPVLWLFGCATYAVFIVLLVQLHQLMPVYIQNYLGEEANVYASAEMCFAFGALTSGLLIGTIARNSNPVKTIMMLMVAAAIVFFICSNTHSVWIFYLFALVVGIANAGTRILRITYLFQHVPNNIIGRTTSVFHFYHIFTRFCLIMLFSIPFFSKEYNVIYSYMICGLFVLLSTIPLLLNYKKLTSNEIS